VIARLTKQWQAERDAFMRRDLSNVDYVYVWVDGIHFNIRLEEERPLMQELAEHLDAFRPGAASGGLVFVGERGGVLRRTFLARVLKPAATRVGLAVGVRAGLDFHGLRCDLAHGRQR
jgi:hypothetical protein